MPQNHVNSYCRVVRLKGDPNKVDEAVKLWTQEILPMLKKQKGFAGATLVGNRETGDGLSVSYWESETTMKEARGQVRPEAIKILSKTGGSMIEDDECEVALLERFKEPKSGVWARVTTVQGDPAHVSEAISRSWPQVAKPGVPTWRGLTKKSPLAPASSNAGKPSW